MTRTIHVQINRYTHARLMISEPFPLEKSNLQVKDMNQYCIRGQSRVLVDTLGLWFDVSPRRYVSSQPSLKLGQTCCRREAWLTLPQVGEGMALIMSSN